MVVWVCRDWTFTCTYLLLLQIITVIVRLDLQPGLLEVRFLPDLTYMLGWWIDVQITSLHLLVRVMKTLVVTSSPEDKWFRDITSRKATISMFFWVQVFWDTLQLGTGMYLLNFGTIIHYSHFKGPTWKTILWFWLSHQHLPFEHIVKQHISWTRVVAALMWKDGGRPSKWPKGP